MSVVGVVLGKTALGMNKGGTLIFINNPGPILSVTPQRNEWGATM